MKRRKFLGIVTAVLGSTAAGSFAYALVRFFAPPSREGAAQHILIKKSDIPLGEAKEVVLNNSPVLVINRPERGYVAFSKVCTHLGCLVEFDKIQRRLVCPCHAGRFDLGGNVISGPPPRPLPKLPLRVEGDEIIIG